MNRTWSASGRPKYVFQHAHPSAQDTMPWYFCSHRLHFSHRFDAHLRTRVGEEERAELIEESGLHLAAQARLALALRSRAESQHARRRADGSPPHKP